MPASTYFVAAQFQFDAFESSELLYVVRSSTNVGMGGIGLFGPPFAVPSQGYGGDWYNPPLLAAVTPGVPHLLTIEHSPAAESAAVDGLPLTFTPGVGLGYVPTMAGLEAEFFTFAYYRGPNPPTTASGWLDWVRIGSYSGGADYLDWDAARDGFGPMTPVFSGALLTGGRIEFPAPFGGGVQFDFSAPWPPLYEVRVTFSVGVTHNQVIVPDVPPPDDLPVVQAALPETLLQEGFRFELGSFNADGSPYEGASERDATLGFAPFEALEDEA